MRSKKKVKVFVSYARANKELAVRFLTRFRQQVSASKRYAYVFWRDTQVLVGENWNDEIQEALNQCDIGLLLISPAFLGSQYIGQKELSRFMGPDAKPLIPIMLQPVDFQHHDLKGLKKAQIFRLDSAKFRSPKAYGDCTGAQRDRFAHELFKQVELRLAKIFGRKSS